MDRDVVYLWRVPDYDPVQIADRVSRSLDGMDLRPRGRVLVKPNCVLSHRQLFPHAFTRAEVLDGVLTALRMAASDTVEELAVGERSAITVPTRQCFSQAGYNPIIERHRFRRYFFDEEPQIEVPLHHPQRLRDRIYLPEPIARTDFMVNCPKLKTHPWTTLTLALKNYIGIQDDAHRLVDHDHRLDEKICDLNMAVPQQLIVVDGISAGLGRMLTPKPVHLGLVIVGKNPVAVDSVIARIADLDPQTVGHIRLAAAYGIGPMAAKDIELRGDIDFEEARAGASAKGYRPRLERVEEFFSGSQIAANAGPPPEPERTDYCWGGCPGAAEEALDIIRTYQPRAAQDARPVLFLYGDLRGRDYALRPGERAFVFGDCARIDGKIGEHTVRCKSLYVDRSNRCIHSAKSGGLFSKVWSVIWTLLRHAGKPYVRVRGCPVSVAEQVLVLSLHSKLANPYLDPRTVVPYIQGFLASGLVIFSKWLTGGLRRKRMPHMPGRYRAVDEAENNAARARQRLMAPTGPQERRTA